MKMMTMKMTIIYIYIYMSKKRVITRRRLPPTVAVAIASRTSMSEGDGRICTDVIWAVSFAGHDFFINNMPAL